MHAQRNNPFFQQLMPFGKKTDSFAPNVVDNQKLDPNFDSSPFSEDEDMPNVRMPQQMQTSVFSAFNFNRPVNTDQFADEFDSSYEFLSPKPRSNDGFKRPKEAQDGATKNFQLFSHNLQKKPGMLQSPILGQKNDTEVKTTAPRAQAGGLNFLNNWKSKIQDQNVNKLPNSMPSNLASPNPLGQSFCEKRKCSPLAKNLLSGMSPVLNFRNSSNSSENKYSRVSFNVDLDEENEECDSNLSLKKGTSPLPKSLDYEKVLQSPSREKRSLFFSPKISLETSKLSSESNPKPTFLLSNANNVTHNVNDVEPFSSSDCEQENPLLTERNHDSGLLESSQSSTCSLQKVDDETSEFGKDASALNDNEKMSSDEENQSDEMKTSDSLSKTERNANVCSANNNADYEKTNLTLLHLKLKNEADKIRKWHLSVENSLKSKETQIVADSETISSLRKSQLDLKLSVESLSSQLKDEVQSRDDFNSKLISTRHLCNALKDHLHRVDEVQKSFNKERLKIHGLIQSLKLLFDKVSAEKEIIEGGIDEMEKMYHAKVTRTKEEISLLQSENENQKKDLQSQITVLQEILCTIRSNLAEKEQKLSDFENACESLKTEIHNQQIAIDQLVLEKQELANNVTDKESIIQKYQDQNSNMNDSISTLEILTNKLQAEILEHEKVAVQNKSLLDNEQEKSLRLENQVKEHENALTLEQKRVEKLEEISNESKERINELTNSIDGLRISLDEKQIVFLKDYSSLLLSNDELANEIYGLNSKLNDAEKHVLDLEDRETDILIHNESIITTVLSDNSVLHKNLVDLIEENQELVIQVENLKKDFFTLETKHSNLKKEIINKESELSILKQDLNSLSDVNDKLKKDFLDATEESIRLQLVVERCTLEIQNLEENLKKTTSVSEEAERLIEKRQFEIEEITKERNSTQIVLADTTQHLQECKDKILELEILLSKEKELHETTSKYVETKLYEIQGLHNELQTKQLECERFQQEHVRLKSELGTILEHYESERLSILKQKENEMEKLKSDLTIEAEKSNKDMDEKMSEANAKIEKLKTQLKNAQTSKGHLTKLKDRNHLLEQELAELKSSSTNELEESSLTIDRLKSQIQLHEAEQKSREEIDTKLESLKVENEAKNLTIKRLECDIENLTSRYEKAEEESNSLRKVIETLKEQEMVSKRFDEKRNDAYERNCEILHEASEIIDPKTVLEYPTSVNVLRSPSPTPIPKETLNNIARTPKSPGLSACLWKDKKMSVSAQHSTVKVGITDLETPRKTPKSILKQPGSASKRRRVFFGGENRHEMSDIESSCSEVVDLQTIELDKIISKQRNVNNKMLQTMRTPKNKAKLFQQRNSPGEKNLRKTPSRTPNAYRGSASAMKPRPKNMKEDFWFDSDNDFGVINEY